MRNKVIEFFSFLSIIFVFILMILSSIRITYEYLSLKDYSMYLYINGGVGLLLYICSKIKNFKFNKYEIIVFIMIILSCLSLINAINVNTAIFGKINRYEGLLVWLTYYILILNAMNIKNKKYLYIIIGFISLYSLINIFYGLYQVEVFSKPSLFKVKNSWYYARGLLGNSMYFGTLSSIFYGLILGIFIKMKLGIKKYLMTVLLLISSLSVIMSGAMSSLVGVIIIYILCLIEIIILIIKKKENSFIYLGSFLVGIVAFLSVFFVYTINHPHIKNDILELFGQAKSSISEGKVEKEYGTGRIYIWTKTLEKLKEAPITGYGIDNFRNAFDSKLIDTVSKKIVDKAHNDYLQKSLCEGIISGIVFIIFLLIIFFKGIFSRLSPLYYGLLIAFISYSVQAFFNISVTRVAPIYYIIIGLLIGKIKTKID